jgi:hypothetical protein
MALTAYLRFRYAWGLVDYTNDPGAPAYHAGNTQSPIANNILCRKAVLEWTRAGLGLDVAQTHLDIANITNGQLDDSWTQADFESCELNLMVMWDQIKEHFGINTILDTIRWYRVGPGATPPEPAVRVLDVNDGGSSTYPELPAQCAANITWRTGVRKAWGRAYLPAMTTSSLTPEGVITDQIVQDIAAAANQFVANIAGGDFHLVVYSPTHQQAYNVERVAVDNIFDTQRRRRHRTHSYQVVHP